MCPMYMYVCPKCKAEIEKYREIPEVYDDVKCESCDHTFDGKKNKIVEGGITVTYEQGSGKGRW